MTDPNVPQRSPLVVHVGAVSERAILTEWWHPLNGDVETRAVRFFGDDDIWLEDDLLPDGLASAGGRITDVVGVANHPGLAHPAVAAGQRLHLQPEPRNPYDPNAIGVFGEDKATQVGYLPPDVAAETMAESRRLRSAFGALVVSESRQVESGQRTAIRILVGPGRVWATAA